MSTYISTPPTNIFVQRHIPCLGYAPINTAARANTTAFLVQVQVPFVCEATSVCFTTGGTAAGAVRVGLYKAASENVLLGGALVAESASTSISGATFFNMVVDFTAPVTLEPGQYWIVIQTNTSTDTIVANGTYAYPIGWGYTFTQAYGAFPATCPAITASTTTLSAVLKCTTP